jgi:PKD repeat protein
LCKLVITINTFNKMLYCKKIIKMKKTYSYLSFLLLMLLFISCQRFVNHSIEEKDGPREARERDMLMMKDPALGYVPTDRLLAAKQYRDGLLQSQNNLVLSGISWNALGPKNQGGRTRALLIDANDASGNTLWAGSVGGGLWKTTNITAAEPNWVPIDDMFANLAVTAIAQDPSNAQVMYFCTGEGYFNADAIQGLGVWKSTNGGANWSQLASTNNANFYSCQKMLVNSAGVVLLATATGLRRSADGGTTWTKVLGTGLGITGAASNYCYDVDMAANGDLYASLNGSVHKSTNAGLSWGSAQTLPIAAGRIELACAANDANYVYALIESGNVVNGILRSIDGGTTWVSRTEPADGDAGVPATDFSRTQAWYDLTIAVDPNNKDVVMVGGVDLFKSNDGAGTWAQIAHWYGGFGYPYVHADQHLILYKPGSSSIAYFTNDGGVYRTANANVAVPTILDKGSNFVTAQFYACAMNPTAFSSYFLAGAQDNGSHQFTQGTLQNTIQVTGGDGAFCHIDQDQPQYQFTSYVYNNYYRSSNSGASWTSVASTGGDFINPTDYDDLNNRMYMCNTSNTYFRWDNPQTGATFVSIAVPSFGGLVSAVKVSPNTANRVFFGIQNGDVFRVDNAHTATPTVTNISTGLPTAYLSCIEVQTGDDNHLLATYSNYGVNSIWESIDGGTTWTSVEGNLPDMPVRWALFNPNNFDQAVIATELGVWSTDNLNGGATVWGASNSGLANVRVDMLQVRSSDKLMIAATHGRGLFSSDVFTSPAALFSSDRITTYQGVPINFNSAASYKATSWNWDFGDGNNSTSAHPSHVYSVSGQFNVTLSINGGASVLTKNLYIQILPNRGTPYTPAVGGDFETNPLDFGIDRVIGTAWERGNSIVAGKNGTVSGANAWVTGLVGNYADNSDANLMTPNYNFSVAGAYVLRFWSKRNTESQYDGIRVEYTVDSGRNWLPLGTTVVAGWYNFANTVGDAAFPKNEAFLSGVATTYSLYSNTTDVSALAGIASVAFRIRFKSETSVNAAGVAIDDFEIIGPINGPLAVDLLSFAAVRNGNDALINWKTSNEVNIQKYELERSNDGLSFLPITFISANNRSSNSYHYTDRNALLAATKYIYYRLRIIDNSGKVRYSDVAKMETASLASELTIGPSPFTNAVSIYSNDAIQYITVYDMSGKLVYHTTHLLGNKIYLSQSLGGGTYLFKIATTKGIVMRKLLKAN